MDADDREWCRRFAEAMGLSQAEAEARFLAVEAAGPDGFLAMVRENGILVRAGDDRTTN